MKKEKMIDQKINVQSDETPMMDVRAIDIPIGYFVGQIGNVTGLFVRNFYGTITYCKNPSLDWTDPKFVVENYKPVKNVNITYEF